MILFNRTILGLSCVLGIYCSASAAVKKLNPSFQAGGEVQLADYVGSSNVNAVVYLAKTNATSQALLYSVPLAGGPSVDLSGAVAGGVVTFKVSKNGDRVVYLASKDNALVNELYSVPTTGGASSKLNANLVAGGNVLDFQLSRDGTQVLYRADQLTDEVFELFAVPIEGGTVAQISTALVAGGDVTENYDFNFNGSSVVYIADQTTDEVRDLFTVTLGVPGSTKIGEFTGPGENMLDFKVSPVADKIVYRKNAFGASQLRSVNLDGNNDVAVNPTLVMGGNVSTLYDFIPDGSQVIYIADQETDEQEEIYIIPVTGGLLFANLNPPLAGDVSEFQFVQSRNAVVYRADQATLNVKELFSSPLIDFTEDKVKKINPPLANDRSITSFRVSPNGDFLVYRANQDNVSQFELYRVSFTGEESVKINPALANGGNVIDFKISPDNSKVIYRADQEVAGTIELYVGDLITLNADYNADGKNDVLIQSKKTLQLLTRDANGTFQVTNFPTELAAKQRVIASSDVDGDGKPEIILGQGKSISIVTVEPDLQQKPASVQAPVLSKGFKLLASGRIGTKPVFVSAKGKNLEVLVAGQKVTGQMDKGNKVFGFETVNNQPSILVNKSSAISAIPLSGQSNQFNLGAAAVLGSVTKGNKPSGVATALTTSNTVEIITRKGKEVRAFALPVSGEGTTLFTAPKKVKVVGPR